MNIFTRPLSPESDLFTNARARYVERVALFSIIAAVIGLIAVLTAEVELSDKIIRFSLVAIFPVLNTGILILARKGHIKLASNLIVIEFMLGTLSSATAEIYWVLFTALLAVTSAAILSDKWLYWLVNVVIAGQFIASAVSVVQATSDVYESLPHIVALLTTLIVGSVSRYFASQTLKAVEVSRMSNGLLQAAADTGQILAKLLTLKDILPRAVELIRERFSFYHVQIFLIDESGKEAQLVVSTGEVGQRLVERHHSLLVGSQSVIGRTTATGQPVIARDTDAVYYRNELLPNTRSELALPIFDGEKIIGALDVQSREYEVFGDEVVQAFQVVANQLGTSIRNARLFENQEKSARESQRLFKEAENNLREIQRLNQQLTRSGWQDYLGSHRQVNGITLNEEQAIMDSQWTTNLLKAGQTRHAVTDQQEQQGVIAVPMMLGNEVIGAIEIEANGNMQQAEITEMVNAVAQRLALSLDKARLFEESQEAAAREQHINQIVARFQTVNNVDDLLRITLEEVSQSLGAKRGFISLSSQAAVSANGERQA